MGCIYGMGEYMLELWMYCWFIFRDDMIVGYVGSICGVMVLSE